MNFKSLFSLAVISFSLVSCASYRPILDENPKYQKVGEVRAERDIDLCLQRAEAYLKKHEDERTRKAVGRSAAMGAIVGGVLGAVSGKGLGGAASGAAVGAGGMAAMSYAGEKSKDHLGPDELKQRYVTNCLERQQYQVIGWK